MTACSEDKKDTPTALAVDDGASLTLWTRAGTEAVSKAFAEAYNASHKNKVQVTA